MKTRSRKRGEKRREREKKKKANEETEEMKNKRNKKGRKIKRQSERRGESAADRGNTSKENFKWSSSIKCYLTPNKFVHLGDSQQALLPVYYFRVMSSILNMCYKLMTLCQKYTWAPPHGVAVSKLDPYEVPHTCNLVSKLSLDTYACGNS